MTVNVAIACQGGAVHSAFTAGALTRILEEYQKDKPPKFRIVGLSGTSGGAICATLAWNGLIENNPDRAIQRLQEFWEDNSAHTVWSKTRYYPSQWTKNMLTVTGLDAFTNYFQLWYNRMADYLPVVPFSPYYTFDWSPIFRQLLEAHINFAEIRQNRPKFPVLILGAANVLSGKAEVFSNVKLVHSKVRRAPDSLEYNDGSDGIRVETVMASASWPEVFRATKVGENYYWDAFYSQNSPIRELPDADPDPENRPDQIWIIQVTPEEEARVPELVGEIRDRQLEMSANLSLNEEVRYIEKLNELIPSFQPGSAAANKYKHIDILRIPFIEEPDLDIASMGDRDPAFIQYLLAEGKKNADKFLESAAVVTS